MKKIFLTLTCFLGILVFVHSQDIIYPYAKKIIIADLKATDPEGTECIFSIVSGNTGGFFNITPFTGIIKCDTLAYESFIRQKTWTLKIKSIDEDKLYKTSISTIILKKDVNGNKLEPIYKNDLP